MRIFLRRNGGDSAGGRGFYKQEIYQRLSNVFGCFRRDAHPKKRLCHCTTVRCTVDNSYTLFCLHKQQVFCLSTRSSTFSSNSLRVTNFCHLSRVSREPSRIYLSIRSKISPAPPGKEAIILDIVHT